MKVMSPVILLLLLLTPLAAHADTWAGSFAMDTKDEYLFSAAVRYSEGEFDPIDAATFTGAYWKITIDPVTSGTSMPSLTVQHLIGPHPEDTNPGSALTFLGTSLSGPDALGYYTSGTLEGEASHPPHTDHFVGLYTSNPTGGDPAFYAGAAFYSNGDHRMGDSAMVPEIPRGLQSYILFLAALIMILVKVHRSSVPKH